MRIEYHRTLIADRVRNEAFFAALKAAIRPGKSVVADIGTGTGLLGLMAAKLGAKTVYMFETAEVARVAAQTVKANKAKNCHVIPCHSTEFRDTLKADVIVSETLGNYAFEENILDTLKDARARFLKPGGVLIPNKIEQFVAPVIAPRIEAELTAWREVGPGLDLGFAESMSRNNVYVRAFASNELLDRGRSAQLWDTCDLTKDGKAARKGRGTWTVSESQTVFGFAVWWRASLTSGISISTAPEAPKTHWEQLYFPLLTPVKLKPGDSMSVELSSRSSERAGTHLAWSAEHRGRNGKTLSRQSLDLDKGYLP